MKSITKLFDMKNHKNCFIFIYLICLGLGMVSCTKTNIIAEDSYKAPDSSYGLIHDKIFVSSCALSGCHADESHASHGHNITLKGASLYDKLINQAPTNTQALAKGLVMVAPGDTSRSWVYQKTIYSRSVHKYGAPMPLGGLKLTANQIQFLKLWIAAGAPKEGHVVDKSLIL
jgi:hypothetical protein